MSDDALPLCACVQYYDSHHPECPARRAYEALASRLDSAENAMREVVSHLQRSQRGSTHWAGCPDVHPVCQAIDMLVNALPLPRAGETEHPEMWCGDCGRPNVIWFAPNKLWNQVMGSPNGIVCLACFAIRADRAGVSGVWRFDLHDARAVETPVNQRGE